MGTLVEDTQRWVEEGLITDEQRAAILAGEAGSDSPSPRFVLPAGGVKAEIFALGVGFLLAALALYISIAAGADEPAPLLLPAGLLVIAGLTLLLSVRGASLLADVCLVAALWIFLASAVLATGVSEYAERDWQALAPIAAIVITVIAVLRIARFVVAAPAIPLAVLHFSGSMAGPAQFGQMMIAGILAVGTVATLIPLRHRIRAWANMRTGRIWQT